MEKILFINACVRPNSRTYELAQTVLKRLDGIIDEVRLSDERITPLDWETLQKRDVGIAARDYSSPIFDYAKQFAEADTIVIAAPYWDLMFPSTVRIYFENITVLGLTFFYTPEGVPEGLCNAKRLIYVTTSGGTIGDKNFGFNYVKALADNFYNISESVCFKAENLDIVGADVAAIMQEAKKSILQL